MCKILLSIKPEYVERIMDGSKIYEFRKRKCSKDIDGIIIYSTAPVKKVVAEADVSGILEGTPEQVWKKTKSQSGISAGFFFQYYAGKDRAFAYKLSNVKKFRRPKTLGEYGISCAQQSFVYVQ